jgi:hypothetical protein
MTVVIGFAELAAIVAIGVCIVYVIFVMREVTAQIGAAVAALEKTSSCSQDSAKQRCGVVQELRDHLAWREEQLADLVKDISDNIQHLQEIQTTAAEAKSATNGNGHYIRLRKELVGLDPEFRFSALNDWVNANYLSFLRRASRGWATPADLIAHIPDYFEAQAEVTTDNFLLIGTRGYPEKVAVRLDDNEFDAGSGELSSSRTELRDEDKLPVS